MIINCPRCGMLNRLPASDFKIVTLDDSNGTERIRFRCDDCGRVAMTVPFEAIVRLVSRGMPAPLVEEEVDEFLTAWDAEPDVAARAASEVSA